MFFKRFFKWVGRGVKKVAGAIKRNWKKIAVVALVGAAAFFTFGSALGIAGGWAAKVGALTSKLGLAGKIGNVVAGAITQAGYGALTGGAIGAVTGQGFMKGAGAGALVGAATGGLTGAFKPVGGAGGAATSATDSAAVPGLEGLASGGGAGQSIMASATPAAGGGAGNFGKVFSNVIGAGGIGPIIQGIGGGIAAGAAARDRKELAQTLTDSYDVKYRPAAPLFRRDGKRILSRSYDELQRASGFLPEEEGT